EAADPVDVLPLRGADRDAHDDDEREGGKARRQAEEEEPSAHELRARGESSLERRRRQAQLGEEFGDLLEIVELPPARLEEHESPSETGECRREPVDRVTDARGELRRGGDERG